MPLRRLALAAALLAAVPAWGKDLVIQRRITTEPGPKPVQQTEYFTAKKTVMDAETERTIVDLDAKTITTVDKAQKTYWTMTFAELKRDLALQREARRKHYATLPKELRDLMRLDQKATTTLADGSRTIAGYATREYRVEAGPVSGTVWATEDLVLPESTKEWRALSSGEGETPVGGLAEAMSKVKGFPMKTVTTVGSGDETQTMTDEILSVKEASPPDDVLVVPPGATKVARPDMPEEPSDDAEE